MAETEIRDSPLFRRPDIKNWPVVAQNPSLSTALEASLAAGELLYNGFYADYQTIVKADRSELTPYDEQAERRAREIILTTEPSAQFSTEEINPNFDISQGNFWTIDGIDGTTNFSRKIPICNFTLAKVENGDTQVGVVYDFLHGDVYYAAKGHGAYKNGKPLHVSNRPFSESVISFATLRDLRRGKWEDEGRAVQAVRRGRDEITDISGRFHREVQSGGLELAWVASGKLDGYAASWTAPWDLSAGVLLVREARGIATDIYGKDWKPSFRGVIAGNPNVHPQLLKTIQKHF